MKKLILWTLILVPVLLIVVIAIVLLKLDSIAKSTIETQATASTTLTTTLNSANISLFGGNVKLADLKVGSPRGFDAPAMFELNSVGVQVSYSELRQTPIRIAEITVNGPKLIVEQKGGQLNLQAAMDQMPKSEPSTLRMIIGKLTVADTHVVLKPNLPMLPPEIDLTLPTITLQNIGNSDNSQNGAAISEVLTQVWAAMAQKLKESDKIPVSVRPLIAGTTSDLKAQAQAEAGKQFNAATQKAAGTIQKQLDTGIQGLLGGKKK
jgi:uncharacterized protein involved in outer membrane biogenesis